MAVESQNDIARLHFRFGCGRSWYNVVYDYALLGSWRLSRLACTRLNSQVTANDAPVLQQTLERNAHSVGRDGKADSLRSTASRNNRSVNADHFAA